MPSGRTHDRITLWTLPLVAGLAIALTRHSTLVMLTCSGFLFGGLMLGPDLDIHSIHFKRWGWFRWIWIPYRGSMRHRSPLSHAPVIGTVLRIIYLGIWLGLLGLLTLATLNQIGQFGWTWEQVIQQGGRSLYQYKIEGLTLGLGLELGALSHYLADWWISTYKRYRTQGWQAFIPHRSARKGKNQAVKRARRSPVPPKRRSKP